MVVAFSTKEPHMAIIEDNSHLVARTGEQQSVSPQNGMSVLDLPEIARVPEVIKLFKQSIELGVSSFHDAAEFAFEAQELGVSQRELAVRAGKSAAWINALLKWREHGYPDDSPFKNRRSIANAVQQTEHTPAEDEVVDSQDNADAFGDNRSDATFSSVRRANLIEALEFLATERPGIRAKLALNVEKRRAELGLTWGQLLIPAEEPGA
jgi:hypothetical protein